MATKSIIGFILLSLILSFHIASSQSLHRPTICADIAAAEVTLSDIDSTRFYRQAKGDFFDPGSGFSTSAGLVTIDGVRLIEHYLEEGLISYRNRHELDSVPLVLDGKPHIIKVSGNTHFPTLIDTLRSPLGNAVILKPQTNDTISRSSGFALNWIPFWLDSVTISITDGHRTYRSSECDDGHFFISPEILHHMHTGLIYVWLAKINLKRGEISTQCAYQISFHTQMRISLHLTE